MQLDSYQSKAVEVLLNLPKDKKKYLSFSGGKDSTALLGLALVAKEQGFDNWEVNHSNTLMEIPMMDSHIEECIKICKQHGVKFNYIVPPIEDRFFMKMIGRGVPVPHRNFRWCTENLKIKPQEDSVKTKEEIIEKRKGRKRFYNPFYVITGERLGESSKRDIKLKGECDPSNECGISEVKSNRFFKEVVRPILTLSTCQVWDTIALLDVLEVLPHSSDRLNFIYSVSEQSSGNSLRTGCIGCPLINKDKSLKRFVSTNPGYSALEQLAGIYLSFGDYDNRIMRPDSKGRGAVILSHRKAMYARILEIESEVQQHHPDFVLIQPEEKAAIEKALAEQRYPKGYTRDYLSSVGAIDI